MQKVSQSSEIIGGVKDLDVGSKCVVGVIPMSVPHANHPEISVRDTKGWRTLRHQTFIDPPGSIARGCLWPGVVFKVQLPGWW